MPFKGRLGFSKFGSDPEFGASERSGVVVDKLDEGADFGCADLDEVVSMGTLDAENGLPCWGEADETTSLKDIHECIRSLPDVDRSHAAGQPHSGRGAMR